MDGALKDTPKIWWETHKSNITDWTQCQTLMTARFLAQVGNCEVRYIGQGCPKDHARSCEEA
jgi:hypothetical protein